MKEQELKELVKQAYAELMNLYKQDNLNRADYIEVAKKYVNLEHSHRNDYTWQRNGRKYRMYCSFGHKYNYSIFAEDVAMMIYRLYDGEDYKYSNTMILIDAINQGTF